MLKNMQYFMGADGFEKLRYFFLMGAFVVQTVWASPEVAFLPEVVVMPEVVVGDSAKATVVVVNVGNDELKVSGHSFAHQKKTVFQALPAQFESRSAGF